MNKRTERVLGKDLCVGDTILVWWRPGRDTIIGILPYNGTLKELKGKCRIGEFALLKVGMTIEDDMGYDRVVVA